MDGIRSQLQEQGFLHQAVNEAKLSPGEPPTKKFANIYQPNISMQNRQQVKPKLNTWLRLTVTMCIAGLKSVLARCSTGYFVFVRAP